MSYDLNHHRWRPGGHFRRHFRRPPGRQRPAAGARTLSPPQSVRRVCLRGIAQPAQRSSRQQHAAPLQDAVRISQARIFLDGRTLQTTVDPPAASIARLDLDAALWHSAESAGVDARQQVTVLSVAGTGPFRIVTTAGEFEARALVNASGRWSNLNLPPRKMECARKSGWG